MVNIERLLNSPAPMRQAIRHLIRSTGLGSWRFQYKTGSLARPHYAYLVYQAAQLAQELGEPRVSVIEFGVAGGDGLVTLEQYAEQVEKLFNVKIEVYGFDTTEGLPAPADYRDLPYHWKAGFFHMDLPLLRSRLKRSQLVIGDTRDTIHTFTQQFNPAPIGAISFDLDFYSSTVAALKILESDDRCLLPRMVVYFDDLVGRETELFNDYIGERLAIHEFNRDHENRKLSPLYCLTATDPLTWWHHCMWSFHAFDHARYAQFISEENAQIPL
jgi:hypothetical protein